MDNTANTTAARLQGARARTQTARASKQQLDEEIDGLTELVKQGRAGLPELQRLHQLADEAAQASNEIVDALACETALQCLSTAEQRRSDSVALDDVLDFGKEATESMIEHFMEASTAFGALCGCIERANALSASLANDSLAGTGLSPEKRAAVSALNEIPDLNAAAGDRGLVPTTGHGWRLSIPLVPRHHKIQEGGNR